MRLGNLPLATSLLRLHVHSTSTAAIPMRHSAERRLQLAFGPACSRRTVQTTAESSLQLPPKLKLCNLASALITMQVYG